MIDAEIQGLAVEILLVVRLGRPRGWAHVWLLLLLPVLLLVGGAGQAPAVAVAQVVRQFLHVRDADAQWVDASLLRAYVARHFSRARVFLPHGWRILRVVQQCWGQGDVTEISAHHTRFYHPRLCSCSSLRMI